MIRKTGFFVEPDVVHPSAALTDDVAVRKERDVEPIVIVGKLEPLKFPVLRHRGQDPEHGCTSDLGIAFLQFPENHPCRCVAVQTFQRFDDEFLLDCVSPFHSFWLLGCHVLHRPDFGFLIETLSL